MSLDFLYPGLGSELVDYLAAWELQRRLHADVSAGTTPDTVSVTTCVIPINPLRGTAQGAPLLTFSRA